MNNAETAHTTQDNPSLLTLMALDGSELSWSAG
jgi:hypothetical protein